MNKIKYFLRYTLSSFYRNYAGCIMPFILFAAILGGSIFYIESNRKTYKVLQDKAPHSVFVVLYNDGRTERYTTPEYRFITNAWSNEETSSPATLYYIQKSEAKPGDNKGCVCDGSGNDWEEAYEWYAYKQIPLSSVKEINWE